MATNPFDVFDQQAERGPIMGPPPTPKEAAPKNEYDILTDRRDYATDRGDTAFDQAGKLRNDFLKDPAVQTYRTAIGNYANSLKTAKSPAGDQSLITTYAKLLDPSSSVREGEFDTTAANDSLVGRAFAKIKKEFGYKDGGLLSDTARNFIRGEIRGLVDNNYRPAYEQQRSIYGQLATRYGFDPGVVTLEDFGDPYTADIESYWKQVEQVSQGGGEWSLNQTIQRWGSPVFDAQGNPLGPDGGEGFDEQGNPLGLFNSNTDTSGFDARQEEIKRRADALNQISNPGVMDLARQGITLGLNDEAKGVGSAISGLLTGDLDVISNYQMGRDVERERLNRARQQTGWAGTAVEAIGGMASMGVGALPALTTRQAASAGATAGAVGGFGYGEGGSDSIASAIFGGALGGALGAGGQMIGNRVAQRAATRQIDNSENLAVAAAGQAENVGVNRAMMDPTGYGNRIYRADASRSGGPVVQRGMERIEGQIEGRVSDLGLGGTPLTPEASGNMLRQAGARQVERTRQIKDKKYLRAARLAGDAQIEAPQALQVVDDMLVELGQNPGANKAAIDELNIIKGDLAGAKSVEARRDILSAFRTKLRRGDLVLNQSEARTAQLQNALASDIQVGLTRQGKAAAAKAYETADKSYAARMGYIENTIQRLIGKRGSELPAEQIHARMTSMARGKDAAGLRKFYASLTPEERADVAATFAEGLGRNNKGEFTVTQFLRQTEGFSQSALTTIFGKEGGQSIHNLRLLAKRTEAVTGSMNSRKSGSGVANYGNLVTDLLLGGGTAGTGMLSGLGAPEAAALGLAVGGARSGAAYANARLLMSPKITKWLRQAPATNNPKAINAHFDRLSEIARAEPAIAADIDALQAAIQRVANDNIPRAGSLAASPNERPDQRESR